MRGLLGRTLRRRGPAAPSVATLATTGSTVCYCRDVSDDVIAEAIQAGAASIADLQRETAACTRCFGCRHELERMLETALGSRYRHAETIAVPANMAKKGRIARPMYMPVLAGLRGEEVDTRVIVFNYGEESTGDLAFRLDLLRPDGERVAVVETVARHGGSAVVDLEEHRGLLPDGFGVAKLVLHEGLRGSLRPYFHIRTPTGVTTTHEKGPPHPKAPMSRAYHWLMPIARPGEEAWFFATNTQMQPMLDHRLVWQSGDHTAACDVPPVEFEQTVCVPLHESFPEILSGESGGAVRLEPATHSVAGFMLRHDTERGFWRVQHL